MNNSLMHRTMIEKWIGILRKKKSKSLRSIKKKEGIFS